MLALTIVVLTAPDQSRRHGCSKPTRRQPRRPAWRWPGLADGRTDHTDRRDHVAGSPTAGLLRHARRRASGGDQVRRRSEHEGRLHHAHRQQLDGYGDSMMVGSIHALDYYFPGIRMDANPTDAGQTALLRSRRAERATVAPWSWPSARTLGSRPEAVAALDALGPDRMVVLVNLMGPFARIETTTPPSCAAASRPNVIVADWAAAVRDHPDQLQSDRIHPSLKGSHLFAKTVRQALATLSERHTGEKVVLKDLPMP